MIERAMCWCGHHRDTHHEKGAADCLGVGCDDCPGFRNDQKPDTLKLPPKRPAHHPTFCLCFECKRAAA